MSPARARDVVNTRNSVLASLKLQQGDVDAVICGAIGPFSRHVDSVEDVIGRAKGVKALSTLVGIILPSGTYFICDTHIINEPAAEELAEMALLAVEEVKRFGLEPRVAFLSHSNFGTDRGPQSDKIVRALHIVREKSPHIEIDGEMHAESALSPAFRNRVFPDSTLSGSANLLVMPNQSAAHIAYSLMKSAAGATVIGPILLGAANTVNIVTQSVSVRGLINMSGVAAVQAHINR